MKYYYNGEFKNIDTPDKAYVLGLFYADGYVTFNPEKSNYFSGIKLHKKDHWVLYQIRRLFPFFKLVFKDETVRISCNKKRFCADLISNGCLPKKSSINKNRLRFPKLDYSLYRDFIRGYFDGDGSIFFSRTNGLNSKGLTITGNNYFLLKQIREWLLYQNVAFSMSHIRPSRYVSIIRGRKITFSSLVFVLYAQNRATIEKVYSYFYSDSTCLHFPRKKLIMGKWYDRIKQVCPRCKSSKTFYQNKEKGDIGCHNCNRYSNIYKTYYDYLKPTKCKFCNSTTNMVQNGYNRSRSIPYSIVSVGFLCRNCNKTSYVKLSAPDSSNAISKR